MEEIEQEHRPDRRINECQVGWPKSHSTAWAEGSYHFCPAAGYTTAVHLKAERST